MAKVDDNTFTEGLYGKVGKDMVFKRINGNTFLTKTPDRSKVVYVKEQKAYQNLFKQASQYASAVIHDPKKAAPFLKKKIPPNQLYHAALKDFIKKHSWKKPYEPTRIRVGEYLAKFPGLNTRQVKAIGQVISKGKLTNGIYQKINNVSKPTATRELQNLVNKGAIIFNGVRGAGAAYNMQ